MESEYTADSIEVLTWPAAARKRPGMYIGATDDGAGPLHLLLALVANAIDQILLARCAHVDVRVEADDFVTVTDDGPGIATRSLVELLEQPSKPPTGDEDRLHVRFGFRGPGLPIVNALSDPFEVETVHAGEQATVAYAAGLRRDPLRVSATSRPSGTRVRFRPDPQIFQDTRVPRVDLTQRLEDVAYLLPARALAWSFAGEGATGLVARVRAEARSALGEVAHHRSDCTTDDGPTVVQVALAWRPSPGGQPAQIHGFVNLQRKADGPHVSGLLAGVREFLKIRDDRGLEGLVAAVAVLHSDARYVIQTKCKVANPALRLAATEATLTALRRWAERFPADADALRRRVKTR